VSHADHPRGAEQAAVLARLRVAEARYRAALEASFDAFFFLECERAASGRIVDFILVDINAGAAAIMQQRREDVLGRRISDLYGDDWFDRLFDKYTRVVETREMLKEEFPAALPDLNIEWLCHRIVAVGDGVAITLHDITQRKRTEEERRRADEVLRQREEALRASEARLRAIFAAMPALFSAFDEERRIVFWNAEAERVTGYTREEIEHAPDRWSLLYPNTAYRQMVEAHSMEQAEVTVRCKDGSDRIIAFRPGRIPIPGWAGWAVGLDVTELRQTQQRLLVSERMASVGTLAGGVAHEINNPLAFVIINLEFVAETLASLISAPPESPSARAALLREAAEAIANTQQGADRVRRIVRDLTVFSRAESEAREPTDVRAVLKACVQVAQNELRHRARVVEDYGPVPLVMASEGRLGQIFLNLLMNAAHAIPEGAADRNQVVIVTRADRDGRAVVEVRDTGQGIQPEVVARIFDPFFTTRTIGKGTGLGLYICYGIVDALGGEIQVEAEPRKGSVFRVLLPPEGARPPRPRHT
jgi:two-component system, cell cycle sensor histidine kinase and response regulator CckA